MTHPFADADIISVYTRDQAIADGVLISANIGDLAEVTEQHLPGVPVAMTTGVFSLIKKAVDHPRWCNDWRGVWHDVLWMARRHNAEGLFLVIITGTGRKRNHVLRIVSNRIDGRKVVTVLLRDED